MAVNSHLRSSAVLLLGAGVSAPLGKKMMGDFVTHLSMVQGINTSQLFQAIAAKKRDLEFLLQELSDLESKAYIDDLKIAPEGGYPTRLFQSTALEASSLRNLIEREVFLHYRQFDRTAVKKIKNHLLPLFDAVSSRLGVGEPLVVFTTNYDPAVEDFAKQVSTYEVFDGFTYDSRLGESVWSPMAFEKWKPSDKNRDILLIKLHGSTNWIEHDGRISKMPGPGLMANDDGVSSNVLIYPAQDKVAASDPFFTAYYLFQHFLKSAECLLSVGYSFRDVDASTRLRTAMMDNEHLQVGLVDPNAEDIRETLAEQSIRVVAIPGKYDPTSPHLPSSPSGNVVPKIDAFLEEDIKRKHIAGLRIAMN